MLISSFKKSEVKNFYNCTLDESLCYTEVKSGLKFLSHMLYTHFNRKVVILIDEYDAPVWKLIVTVFLIGVLRILYISFRLILQDNEYMD